MSNKNSNKVVIHNPELLTQIAEAMADATDLMLIDFDLATEQERHARINILVNMAVTRMELRNIIVQNNMA